MADLIDKLLDDLANEVKAVDPVDRLLSTLKDEQRAPAQPGASIGQQTPSPAPPPASAPHLRDTSSVDRLLREVSVDRASAVERSLREVGQELTRQRAEAEQQAQEKLNQARLERANGWLAKLDPYSNEGMWFHEFAHRYPSLLDAALDYLDAVRGPVDKPR